MIFLRADCFDSVIRPDFNNFLTDRSLLDGTLCEIFDEKASQPSKDLARKYAFVVDTWRDFLASCNRTSNLDDKRRNALTQFRSYLDSL